MYLLVVLLAAGVGAAVYLGSLRAGSTGGDGGFGPGAEPVPPVAPQGGAYVPVTTARSDWQTRLTGFLGLLIMVAVGSVVLAVTLYVSVSLLVGLFGGSGDGATIPVQ